MSRRVVITGLGSVNCVGKNVTEYWEGLISGKCGIKKIERFDAEGYKLAATVAGEITDFNPEDYFEKKEARKLSRFIQFACIAATEAVKDSGLDISQNAEKTGVFIGSGVGGLDIIETASKTLETRGASKVSPFTVPMMIPDLASGQVSIKIGAKGPNSCIVTACASGTHSIGEAFKTIQRGAADAMVAGGTEAAITPVGMASFIAARALCTDSNDSPETASKPFDKNRSGFVMGEGAGVVILEEYEQAKARGAKIYAEIVGYGLSGDAYHITSPAPEGEGGARAIQMCLDDAGLNPEEVDYINAHGTATALNDKYETAGIKRVFGENTKVPVSSTKGATGHLLGAAGGIEFVALAKAVETGVIPPTINYKTPDPECDLDYVPNSAREADLKVAISNSFGFGGHNGILAIKKI